MKSIDRKVWLYLCAFSLALGFARAQQPQPQPATQPQAATQPQPLQQQQKTGPTTAASKGEEWDTGEGQVAFGLFYWPMSAVPAIHTGRGAVVGAAPSNLTFTDKTNYMPGAELDLPIGHYHSLRLWYFRSRASGSQTAPQDLNIVGTDFSQGDFLTNVYSMQVAKASLDFTSWPFPVGNARFRVKTLWEMTAASMRYRIDAPLKPTTDSEGNYVNTEATATRYFLSPSFGMGVEYLISHHLRFDGKASGFDIPHHSNNWDAEATFAYRRNQIEMVFGARSFHFRTSPNAPDYISAALSGPFVGVRWYPNAK